MQLLDCEAVGEVVIGVDHHGQGIEGDLNLEDIVDAVLGAGVNLVLPDGARGVVDIRLAGAEGLEASTGSGEANVDEDIAGDGVKILGDGRRDREYRGGAVDVDLAALAAVIAGNDGQRRKRHEKNNRERRETGRARASCLLRPHETSVGGLCPWVF